MIARKTLSAAATTLDAALILSGCAAGEGTAAAGPATGGGQAAGKSSI